MDGVRSGEWQRGVLATCALAVLADGETHGYAIAQRLQAAGIGTVRGGALYPVLNKLEQDGLLTSTWQEGTAGPGRKVFRLTASGRERTQQVRDGWPAFAAAVAGVLGVRLETPVTVDEGER
ncbi:PadR family transcriptional regulator PadR [Kineococcus radiotolerans]|uniref:PadR family transcriptional regulator PadR n=1 Tax=Kineococcus radiotolerans TaxID=131568 RepID=A0A7W4XZ86_KINRA|nr:PadR family transcriptional regulator [Kineococcus radiotolerans]MBB2903034.1 PadR family transcriptional regulator PadR [Kineococcus radiotolerans]